MPAAFSPLLLSFGAAGTDYGKDIISDAAGNLYAAGYFQGTVDFDPGAGTVVLTAAGNPTSPAAVDMYLAKYDSTGALQWAFNLGAIGVDMPHSIVLDRDGNILMTGYFSGQVDFDPSAAVSNLAAGVGRNIFLAKYSSAGQLIWAKGFGDVESSPTDEAGREEGMDLVVDVSGNVYLTGLFNGSIDLDPADSNDSADTFTSRERDIFIAAYDASGNYRWGKFIGGAERDAAHAIDVDANGNIIVAGFFSGAFDFAGKPVTSNGGWDAFIAQFDPSGSLMWVNTFGGTANDQVRPGGIAMGPANTIYVTGDFGTVTDFDPGANTASLTSNGLGDIFIAKYQPDGSYLWAIGMGGARLDGGHRIAVSSTGDVYLTGWFRQSADFDPGVGTAMLTALAVPEASDVLVAAYTSDGAYKWARQFGAPVLNADEWSLGTGITLTPDDGVVVTGRFFQTADFDPGPAESLLTSNGLSDAFILKLKADSGDIK
jgi:hypothetical protein